MQQAYRWGPICPQNPSKQEFVLGPQPTPRIGSGVQDERFCGMLSIYQPLSVAEKPASAKLPVIVFVHGGAWVTGGSQMDWYDGSALAKDGGCIVVCINYRLGVFGFLHLEGADWAPGFQDIITAFEWVRKNISAFGGDKDNITGFGQSAGAYMIQMLIDERPDLFRRAIIQSAPGNSALTPEQGMRVTQAVQRNLPDSVTLETASTEDLLRAQSLAIAEVADTPRPFAPVVSRPPRTDGSSTSPKDILILWTAHDGSVLAARQQGLARTRASEPLSHAFTREVLEMPSRELAVRLRRDGHAVTMGVHEWAPDGFALGAAHGVDLPLVFGSFEAWKAAPVLGTVRKEEWDRRGKAVRRAWGRFAKDGYVPESIEGVRLRV